LSQKKRGFFFNVPAYALFAAEFFLPFAESLFSAGPLPPEPALLPEAAGGIDAA
jgi:hypothetical protein